jgi:8-oxoguanine deaminase
MSTVLTNANWIYTCDDDRPLVESGYIVIEDGRIASIGSGAPSTVGDEVIDLWGAIVVPGLINLHHHFFQTISRAVPVVHRMTTVPWLMMLYPLWCEIEPEDLSVAVRHAAAELLLSGVTTSVDHSFLLRTGAQRMTGVEIAAARQMGIKLKLVRGSLPILGGKIDEDLRQIMGPRIDRLIDDDRMLIAECREDVERYHDPSPGSMVHLALGPSIVPFTKSHLLRQMAALSEETGCGLHTHYHPSKWERAYCRRTFNSEPIDFLEQCGWLRRETWFAHCTELDHDDIAGFARHGVGFVHCPRTILRLGYPIPPIARIRKAGVPIGVGVDGSASNDGTSFVSDLRLALLLHRANSGHEVDPLSDWLTPYDALRMATTIAAGIIGRDDIGQLKPGMSADIAAFDLSGTDCAGSLADPLGGFLMAGTANRARLTMVSGRVIVRDGRLLHHSERTIADDANDSAKSLIERAEKRYPIKFRSVPVEDGAARYPMPQ